MSTIPNPEFEAKSGLDHWKKEEILTDWFEKAEILSDAWSVEPSIFDGFQIEVENDFGAKVFDEKIVLSDPDLYKAGMRQIFDGKEEEFIREMVDEMYPIPFHEIVEETGQWIGRNYPNGWEREGREMDRFVDEMYGMMALKEVYPKFFSKYSKRIENNIEVISEINDRGFIDYIVEEGSLTGMEVSRKDELTRIGDEPKSFLGLMREIDEEVEYEVTDMDTEELEELRQDKLKSEVSEWEDYLAACRVVEPDEGHIYVEDPARLVSLPVEGGDETLRNVYHDLKGDIEAEYNIP